ncbi:hypothetical protein [Streptomyces sp. NPDC055607]
MIEEIISRRIFLSEGPRASSNSSAMGFRNGRFGTSLQFRATQGVVLSQEEKRLDERLAEPPRRERKG